MKEKILKRGWKVIKIIWGSFCLLLVYLSGAEFFISFNHNVRHPEFWDKLSHNIYLWGCVFYVIWCGIGFFLCLLQHRFQMFKWAIVVHILATIMIVYVFHMHIDALFSFLAERFPIARAFD